MKQSIKGCSIQNSCGYPPYDGGYDPLGFLLNTPLIDFKIELKNIFGHGGLYLFLTCKCVFGVIAANRFGRPCLPPTTVLGLIKIMI